MEHVDIKKVGGYWKLKAHDGYRLYDRLNCKSLDWTVITYKPTRFTTVPNEPGRHNPKWGVY